MHSTTIAEWMIARFTDRNRAASIIGDLSEAQSEKGKLWFWLAVTGILVRLIWLPTVTLLVAFFFGAWAVLVIVGTSFAPPHRPGGLWLAVLWNLISIGTVLWIGLIYGAIRHGVKDRLVHLTLVITVLVSLTVCYWWEPYVMCAGLALIIAVVAACAYRRETRRYAFVLILFVIFGIASTIFSDYLTRAYLQLVISGPVGDAELRAHPSIRWMPICLSLLNAWIFTNAYSWLHRRFLEKKELKSGFSFFA